MNLKSTPTYKSAYWIVTRSGSAYFYRSGIDLIRSLSGLCGGNPFRADVGENFTSHEADYRVNYLDYTVCSSCPIEYGAILRTFDGKPATLQGAYREYLKANPSAKEKRRHSREPRQSAGAKRDKVNRKWSNGSGLRRVIKGDVGATEYNSGISVGIKFRKGTRKFDAHYETPERMYRKWISKKQVNSWKQYRSKQWKSGG